MFQVIVRLRKGSVIPRLPGGSLSDLQPPDLPWQTRLRPLPAPPRSMRSNDHGINVPAASIGSLSRWDNGHVELISLLPKTEYWLALRNDKRSSLLRHSALFPGDLAQTKDKRRFHKSEAFHSVPPNSIDFTPT
jgi:hypothetical protein